MSRRKQHREINIDNNKCAVHNRFSTCGSTPPSIATWYRIVWGFLLAAGRCVRTLFLQLKTERSPRTLRVRETASFGDKRFVALIEVGSDQYLIGGTPTSLSLLATLREHPENNRFNTILQRCDARELAIQ